MDFRVILDLIIAVLLVATIGYAVTLNSRLTALRRNRDQLSKIISAFNEATLRAEASIPKLKRAAEEAGGGLQDRMEKAQSLRDDLAFMIERADTMANRLENSVRSARGEVRGGAQTGSGAPSGRQSVGGAGNVVGTGGLPLSPSFGGSFKDGPALRDGPGLRDSRPHPLSGDDDLGGDDRSEAERELLRALQSMR